MISKDSLCLKESGLIGCEQDVGIITESICRIQSVKQDDGRSHPKFQEVEWHSREVESIEIL